MITRVKICGVKTLDAAKVATEEGADFLGFNFVSTSKRYIIPADAKEIINIVKGKVKVVGVFQDADIKQVNDVALSLGLDFVQLHGNENNAYINNVSVPVIKVIKADDQIDNSPAAYVLLDRVKQGEGEMVDLKKAANLAAKTKLFYAGGLTPDNVAGIIKEVKPFAVDVASGIETDDKQDENKIRSFIKNAKEAV